MAPSNGTKNGSKNGAKNGAKAGGGWCSACAYPCAGFVLLIACLATYLYKVDMLKGMDSNREHTPNELAFYATAFCLSPVPGMLIAEQVALLEQHGDKSLNFNDTGNIEDDDYSQESIYAIFYALYKTTELTSQHGVKYQFTFNTWGFNSEPIAAKAAASPFLGGLSSDAQAHFDFQERFPERDPERYGKMAYASLPTMNAALEYMKAHKVGLGNGTQLTRVSAADADKPKPVEIVEIGCGTGAGANLISRHVVQNSNYLALDMQKAAVNTCQQRHEGRGPEFAAKLKEAEAGSTPDLRGDLEAAYPKDNPSLECRLVPNGVGHLNNSAATETNSVPRASNSVDFVIISETHIADMKIGDLEKAIFTEIKRVLKPGGLFLWGNAIPTRVWREAEVVLPQMGFELVQSNDHTPAAVVARDLDAPRVDLAISQLLAPYNLFKIPYFGPRCHHVVERLIANFYRHPGTALYVHMQTKFDSYLQQAWRLKPE